jgi:23S rRNA (cytosine1962-C5)-methyltransferase
LAALSRDAATVQDGDAITFRAPVDFTAEPRLALRRAILDPALTDCFRALHGAADRWPGWQVEKLGPFLLSQAEAPLSEAQRATLSDLVASFRSSGSPVRGAYHKRLSRHVRQTTPDETSPVLEFGEAAPDRFAIRENGLSFELSFSEGYSVGLFLDQRDNRRRLLTRHIAADFSLEYPRDARPEVLNTFAYTGGFSVCAALGGARVTSLDLSRKYLDWARRNFTLNGLDPAEHDFIYGDVFDWLRRLTKKQRRFDVVLLDPPTFSQSKEHGVFRAEKDYGALVTATLPLLAPEGVLFASTNAAGLAPEKFLAQIDEAVRAAGRRVVQRHYVPQPPDFPITREEPAYLKTVWLRVA